MKTKNEHTPPTANAFARTGSLLAAALVLCLSPLGATTKSENDNDDVDPTVALTENSSQGYPGENIHPDICLNAQSEYESTKFDVSITPNTGTATLSRESGDVSLDVTSVSDGDTVTVTGNSTGSYEIKITHDEDDTVTDTDGGTVFVFKFADLSLIDDSSDFAGNASAGSSNVTCSTTQNPGEHSAAYAQQDFELKVETEPSGAFSKKVDAEAKIEQKYEYDFTLAKGQNEDGSTQSIGLAWGVLSFSWGSNGSKNVAGYGVSRGIKIDTGSWSTTKIIEVDTDEIEINWFSPASYATNDWTNDDYTATTTYSEREYDLSNSSQHYDFSVRIYAGANSSEPLSGAGYDGASANNDSGARMWTSQFVITEEDDTYEIK